jgi:glucosyl-3-phosphoglycerate synthase
MADFYQNGVITTLHDLSSQHVDVIESDLKKFSESRKLGLLLPSLYSELEGKALPHIVSEISKVDYLNEIVIGLDRADASQFRKAIKFFSSLPQHFRILWNDGPRLKAIDEKLRTFGLSPQELGKGRNVWFCMGYLIASGKSDSIALHDCDILTYDRSLLARLLYPVANPQFNYNFSKGYYARVADGKINGRVSRLLVTPLLRALKKVLGANDYLEYMDSFRYPLAGEFSFRKDVLYDLRIPSDWGLEIGVLSEMQRNYSTNRICQVDIAKTYDHKHQKLSLDDQNAGLSKMSIDITKALFRKLATQGETLSMETFRSIKATYYRIALDFIDHYHSDAVMNGLKLDVYTEENAVEMFAQNIMNAGQQFLENPMETPFLPNWTRVTSAIPEILNELTEAVELDYKEFS